MTKSAGVIGAPPPVVTPSSSPPLSLSFPDVTVDVDADADGKASEGAGRTLANASTCEDNLARDCTRSDDSPADTARPGDEVDVEKAAAVKAAAKREKDLKKAIKDYMKTSLSRCAPGSCLRCALKANLCRSVVHP